MISRSYLNPKLNKSALFRHLLNRNLLLNRVYIRNLIDYVKLKLYYCQTTIQSSICHINAGLILLFWILVLGPLTSELCIKNAYWLFTAISQSKCYYF